MLVRLSEETWVFSFITRSQDGASVGSDGVSGSEEDEADAAAVEAAEVEAAAVDAAAVGAAEVDVAAVGAAEVDAAAVDAAAVDAAGVDVAEDPVEDDGGTEVTIYKDK